MSLLGTIQLATNALNAASLGLQVTGDNIANANTPGYIRTRLLQTPQVPQQQGTLLLGLGVKVDGVAQVIDRYLEERLRNAGSDLASSAAQDEAFTQLESVINELGSNDLSTSFTSFFGAIHDVLNQPESASVRNIAVQRGGALADSIRRLDDQVRQIHVNVNDRIAGLANDINGLLRDVAKLNEQIVAAEGGSVSPSDAAGLRDRRSIALAQLAEIADIRTLEQPTGDVTVFSGGDFLVAQGIFRPVKVVTTAQDGLQTSEIRIAELDAPLVAGGGRLGGLLTARDSTLQGFLTDLDDLANSLIGEFNKIYSGGQGLTGYTSLTSEQAVPIPGVPLDAAGLAFTPGNGLFQVQLYSAASGTKTTTDIRIDLNGLDADTTLNDVVAQLDAIDGISASLSFDNKLQIAADGPQLSFAFSGDTSGVLAALGLNTFFSGTGAVNIGINSVVRSNPSKFAASTGGVGEDTNSAAILANFLTAPLASRNGSTLASLYDQITTGVAQGAQSARGAADGLRSFQQTLEGQHLAISGVNLDEEAVRLIEYQRAYQASARLISTINEILQTLLSL